MRHDRHIKIAYSLDFGVRNSDSLPAIPTCMKLKHGFSVCVNAIVWTLFSRRYSVEHQIHPPTRFTFKSIVYFSTANLRRHCAIKQMSDVMSPNLYQLKYPSSNVSELKLEQRQNMQRKCSFLNY